MTSETVVETKWDYRVRQKIGERWSEEFKHLEIEGVKKTD